MSVFYDDVLEFMANRNKGKMPEKVEKSLKDTIVIQASNVAKYILEVNEQDVWDIRNDFPNIAPPFQNFWIEYTLPKTLNRNGNIEYNNLVGSRIGILFVAEKHDNSPYENHKWNMAAVCFVSKNKQIVSPLTWMMGITADGQVVKTGGPEEIGFSVHVPPALFYNAEHVRQQGRGFLFMALAPALLAISFMHCKNVKLEEQALPRRKRKKRKTQPVDKYYTLEIEPMKKVLRSEGNSESTGIKHALHICRGHFKDFRNGAGLFGKYKGLYWWDSQVRGNKNHGTVSKNYNVGPPSQDAS